METNLSRPCHTSAAVNSRRPVVAIGTAREFPCFRVRARDLVRTRAGMSTRVVPTRSAASKRMDANRSNVTFITGNQVVRSQTVGERRWTIEMTQSAFHQACAAAAPGREARTGGDAVKTAAQELDNALIREEDEKSEVGR